VKNLLDLEVIGFDYPGHIANAVHFSGEVCRDYVIKRFVICDPTSFGKYLKKLLTEKQFSQRELARLSKVSHDSIRNWEGDRFFPEKESLAKLASFFQIDEQFLLNFDA